MNLTPNEIIGYRVVPDQWNWTTVVVKKYGKDSKFCGQEYKTPMTYHKNINDALNWIFEHVSKMEGQKLQKEVFENTGRVGDLKCLEAAFEKAKIEVNHAIEDLENRLKKSNIVVDIYKTDKLVQETLKPYFDDQE